MKTRLLILIGISFVVFGLINLFSYLPILSSSLFLNTPFPFEEIQSMNKHEEGQGIITVTANHSFESALQLSPYWLFWSLALYAGIGIVGFTIWRNKK